MRPGCYGGGPPVADSAGGAGAAWLAVGRPMNVSRTPPPVQTDRARAHDDHHGGSRAVAVPRRRRVPQAGVAAGQAFSFWKGCSVVARSAAPRRRLANDVLTTLGMR